MHVAQSFVQRYQKNNLFCNDCHSCNLFSANSHPDIKVIERSKDRTQIQIKQIRDASDFIYSTPLIADKKIVLILRAEELIFCARHFIEVIGRASGKFEVYFNHFFTLQT